TVTAASNNQALIPNGNLTVSYTSPNQTGMLTYTPVAGASGVATVTVTVTDSGGASTSRSFIVAVAPSNAAPVVTPSAGSLTYNQGQAATPIDAGLTVTDASPTLIGASVAIVKNFAAGQDVLGFNSQNGITGT